MLKYDDALKIITRRAGHEAHERVKRATALC
jgi:hypothetical protein